MSPPPDDQLLDAIHRGQTGALGRLVEAYQDVVFNVCYRMLGNREDAADAAQDTLVKVVEAIEGFRGQSQLSTWIVRVAMNQSITALRKRKVRRAVSLEANSGSASQNGDAGADAQPSGDGWRGAISDWREPSPSQRVETQEMVDHLHVALGQLDESFRAILVLRDIEQMDYHQIGQVLELPRGTVKSRLFRARLALRQKLEAMDITRSGPAPNPGNTTSNMRGESEVGDG